MMTRRKEKKGRRENKRGWGSDGMGEKKRKEKKKEFLSLRWAVKGRYKENEIKGEKKKEKK